jgi:serine/threonine protein kinase
VERATRWDRVKGVCNRVLERRTHEWPSALRQLCNDDDGLHARVQTLLAAHAQPTIVLDRPQRCSPPDDFAATTLLEPGTHFGPYELRDHIASGGMGDVYRAIDTRLQRDVAVKLLSPQFAGQPEMRARFDREAHAIARLNHPNICTLLDVGRAEGISFLVFEYIEGETLAARLARGRLAIGELLRIAIDILSALDDAHRHGVIHRDVKPANIMLTRAGAKLCDFGVALLRRADGAAMNLPAGTTSTLTNATHVAGTLQYMSPEQLEGREADHRSDIFAFGAVLYEMATGQKAFDASTRETLIAAVVTSQPPPISLRRENAPPLLEYISQRCLEKDPDERWQNTRDLLAVIRALQLGHGRTAKPAEETLPKRRVRGAHIAVALSIGALTIVLSAMYRRSDQIAALRFTVTAPQDADFALTPTISPAVQLALSPDGQSLAFVAASVGGRPYLWLRKLDDVTARLLPGTAGASYPFWSPDNRSVGFFADGLLKRTDPSVVAISSSSRFRPRRSPSPDLPSPSSRGLAVRATATDPIRPRSPACSRTPKRPLLIESSCGFCATANDWDARTDPRITLISSWRRTTTGSRSRVRLETPEHPTCSCSINAAASNSA